jgi:hypothetical protein
MEKMKNMGKSDMNSIRRKYGSEHTGREKDMQIDRQNKILDVDNRHVNKIVDNIINKH